MVVLLSNCIALLQAVAGMQDVVPCGRAVETAEAGVELTITAKQKMRGIPGDHYVVPGLGDDLISFHELERHDMYAFQRTTYFYGVSTDT